MSDEPIIDHQTIAEAFQPAQQLIDRLPDGFERRRATDNLKISEDYVHGAREKIRPEPAGA